MAEVNIIVENFETGAIPVPKTDLTDQALKELASSGDLEAVRILASRQ